MLDAFLAFNANAFFAISYFLKNNFLFLIVIASIIYMFITEVGFNKEKYVYDDRRIL